MQPDLDGDGKVEFGESLPDADIYVAAAREFGRYAKELDGAARNVGAHSAATRSPRSSS